MKKVLVIGSGGREDALVWKLRQSIKVGEIFKVPFQNTEKIISFAKEKNVDLVVVAPDDALSVGVVDALQKENIAAFGPTEKAAQIESSKAFAKDIMKKYNNPIYILV